MVQGNYISRPRARPFFAPAGCLLNLREKTLMRVYLHKTFNFGLVGVCSDVFPMLKYWYQVVTFFGASAKSNLVYIS